MLTYNDPNRTKERQEVNPLSDEGIKDLVYALNDYLEDRLGTQKELQRLLDHYQNLQHFYSCAGGWNGLLKLQALKPVEQTGDIEVNYEIVKTT